MRRSERNFLKCGAFIEHCYTTLSTGKVSWDVFYEQIRAIGPGHVVLIGTDLGGKTTVSSPTRGWRFSGRSLENGFTEEDVRTMIVHNPTSLLE